MNFEQRLSVHLAWRIDAASTAVVIVAYDRLILEIEQKLLFI